MRRGGSPERGSDAAPAPLSPSDFSQGCPMHLPVRLRVPLAGFALCSVALLISACGGGSSSPSTAGSSSFPADAVAVLGGQTVPRTKLTTLMTQVCQQYK